MKQPFTRIGIAVTFSPGAKALLAEGNRFARIFGAASVILYAGEKTADSLEKLNTMAAEAGFGGDTPVIIENGDPSRVIIKRFAAEGVDLIIAGAVEKESLVRQYLGSIARKLMRESGTSILIMTEPHLPPRPDKKIAALVEYREGGEKTIITAAQICRAEGATALTLVRDFHVPGLSSTVWDTGSTAEAEQARGQFLGEERDKISLFAREIGIRGIEIIPVALYGKEGWEAANYVREINADLYVVPAPEKKSRFIDRLFSLDHEYTFDDIPANLLIVR